MNWKRAGIFYIDRPFFEQCVNGEGANVFDRMVIFRAEPEFQTDRIKYFAVHPDFELLDGGLFAPTYRAEFRDGASVPTWVRDDDA
jgi:hypothetical protein